LSKICLFREPRLLAIDQPNIQYFTTIPKKNANAIDNNTAARRRLVII